MIVPVFVDGWEFDCCRGDVVVRRVRLVPVIYKKRGQLLTPIDEGPPRAAQSTAERQENDLLLIDLLPNDGAVGPR